MIVITDFYKNSYTNSKKIDYYLWFDLEDIFNSIKKVY